jgi:hypothetical protein
MFEPERMQPYSAGAGSAGPGSAGMWINTMLVDRRSAAMTSHESPGFLHRMLIALGRALRRGILGKSSHDYMKQFGGSDEYWDRVYEPVHGWTKRQYDDYMGRNPGYRATYEAELQRHCFAVVHGGNGASFDWFGSTENRP